jgi:hypothetical protein
MSPAALPVSPDFVLIHSLFYLFSNEPAGYGKP